MNTKLTTLGLAGLFALTSFVAQPVRADEWNKKTEFQFSAPVQIPGKTLEAGKYVFQLADSDFKRPSFCVASIKRRRFQFERPDWVLFRSVDTCRRRQASRQTACASSEPFPSRHPKCRPLAVRWRP